MSGEQVESGLPARRDRGTGLGAVDDLGEDRLAGVLTVVGQLEAQDLTVPGVLQQARPLDPDDPARSAPSVNSRRERSQSRIWTNQVRSSSRSVSARHTFSRECAGRRSNRNANPTAPIIFLIGNIAHAEY